MDEPEEGFEEEPLDEEERVTLQQDLVDIRVLKELLEPRGIKGTELYCPDCEENHYLAWDLLAGNLEEILENGESPVHEPAFEPDPEQYRKWEWAQGFLDGYISFEQEELSEVTSKLSDALRGRGWRVDEVKSLLSGAGLQVPPPGAGAREDAADD